MPLFFFPMKTKKAVEGVKEKSNKYLSLNGMWRFQWVPDLTDRPADFFQTNYDDKAWDLIEVPGIWEMHGYGDPVYSKPTLRMGLSDEARTTCYSLRKTIMWVPIAAV